jgi:hypothetical protein
MFKTKLSEFQAGAHTVSSRISAGARTLWSWCASTEAVGKNSSGPYFGVLVIGAPQPGTEQDADPCSRGDPRPGRLPGGDHGNSTHQHREPPKGDA